MMPKLLTVAQVAKLLKISEASVYRNVREGKLPGVKPTGKRLLFDAEQLMRLMKTRRRRRPVCA